MITVVKNYDYSELKLFCCAIIETFEDFLDERGIVIENDEKLEDPEGACNIYGTDYGELEDNITGILYSYGLVKEVEANARGSA